MQLGASDDLGQKAMDAVRDVTREGWRPSSWVIGREVLNRVRRGVTWQPEFTTLVGLPFEVKKDAPPDLLELVSL